MSHVPPRARACAIHTAVAPAPTARPNPPHINTMINEIKYTTLDSRPAGQLMSTENSTSTRLSVGRVHYECTSAISRGVSHFSPCTSPRRRLATGVLTSPTASRRASGPYLRLLRQATSMIPRGAGATVMRTKALRIQKEAWHTPLASGMSSHKPDAPLASRSDQLPRASIPSATLTWLRLPHPNRAIR